MSVDSKSNVYLASQNYWPILDDTYTPFILKYDSSGILLWKIRDSSGTFPEYMTVDKYFNLYLTGYKDNRICTVKYSQPIGIKIISENIAIKYKLYQNFPNPFNPYTIIEYQIPIFEYVNLIIYDILGKQISILVNQEQRPGIYNVTWDASNYSSRIYLYQIKTDFFILTKKMVLIK